MTVKKCARILKFYTYEYVNNKEHEKMTMWMFFIIFLVTSFLETLMSEKVWMLNFSISKKLNNHLICGLLLFSPIYLIISAPDWSGNCPRFESTNFLTMIQRHCCDSTVCKTVKSFFFFIWMWEWRTLNFQGLLEDCVYYSLQGRFCTILKYSLKKEGDL